MSEVCMSMHAIGNGTIRCNDSKTTTTCAAINTLRTQEKTIEKHAQRNVGLVFSDTINYPTQTRRSTADARL